MKLLDMVNNIISNAVTGNVELKDGSTRKADGSLKKSVIKNIQKKRKSDIVWMNDRWIYKNSFNIKHTQSKCKVAGWNFQWEWSESCHIYKIWSRSILWLAK